MVELNSVSQLAAAFAPFRKRRKSAALQNASEARHRWFLPNQQSREAAWMSQNDYWALALQMMPETSAVPGNSGVSRHNFPIY
jgi:hypothetical protein